MKKRIYEGKESYDWYENVKKDFSISQKIVLVNDEGAVLLMKTVIDARWDLPGGHFEKDDQGLIESLKREVDEEIGKDVEYEVWREISVDLRIYKGEFKNIKISYLGEYISGDITLSEEHSEFKWVKFEEIENIENCKEWLKGVLAKAKIEMK